MGRLAEALVAELRAIPGTVDVDHDAETRLFELAIRSDETAHRLAGLERATLGRSLAEALSGRTLAELHNGTSPLPVLWRAASGTQDVAQVADLPM